MTGTYFAASYIERGRCPFHGPECWHECGMDSTMQARARQEREQVEKDRIKNNELALKYPHLYRHKER